MKTSVKVTICTCVVVLLIVAVVSIALLLQNEISYLDRLCDFCECKAVYNFSAAECKEENFCPECFGTYLKVHTDALYKLYIRSKSAV